MNGNCLQEDISFIDKFEEKVENGFYTAGLDSVFFKSTDSILLGVSGGADSVAMLFACLSIIKKAGGSPERMKVVTIDHNIRPKEESGGDAAFVQNLCYENNVECHLVVLPKGLVELTAAERMKGVEESARFLRYQAFDGIIKRLNAGLFCLAHNRNDQLETLIMRFFQGSDTASSCGIPRSRGVFCRPMLDISRQDIERYLELLDVPFRMDKTNFDEAFLRNRIRSVLMPAVSKVMPGWDKSVLAGAEKQAENKAVLDAAASGVEWHCEKKGSATRVFIDLSLFYSLLPAIRRMALYRAFNQLELDFRVPYKLIKEVVHSDYNIKNDTMFSCSSSGLRVYRDETCLYVELEESVKTECVEGFYSLIDSPGVYKLPFGTIQAKEIFSCDLSHTRTLFAVPVVLRSPQPSDCVIHGGVKKNLMEYFAEIKIPTEKRHGIPVIEQAGQDFVCILPGFLEGENKDERMIEPTVDVSKKIKTEGYLSIEMMAEDW